MKPFPCRRTIVKGIACLLLAGALTGCGGHASQASPQSARNLVLRTSDLPKGFASIGSGREDQLARVAGAPGPPAGTQSTWYADFRLPGGVVRRGALVVQSSAVIFDSTGSAEKQLELVRASLEQDASSVGAGIRLVHVRLGEAMAGTVERSPGAQIDRLVWRRGKVLATLVVTGLEGRLTVADGLKLARRQDARLMRSAG